jgi:deoxyribodipyrimidine photo-lyase
VEPLLYPKLENSIIFWFRRDLRLDDNHGLYRALKESRYVVPIFIYDSDITDKIIDNDHRLKHIFNSVEKLNLDLKKLNKKIFTFKGKPLEIFRSLIRNNKISKVYYNKDY